MRYLFMTCLLLFSPATEGDETTPATLRHCTIAVFEAESSWTISCPSGTPLNIVAAISDVLSDGDSDSVTLDITRGSAFKQPICVRWTLLELSHDGCRISPSHNVDWSKLSTLTSALKEFGYTSDYRLSHAYDLVSIEDEDDWVWIVTAKKHATDNHGMHRSRACELFGNGQSTFPAR